MFRRKLLVWVSGLTIRTSDFPKTWKNLMFLQIYELTLKVLGWTLDSSLRSKVSSFANSFKTFPYGMQKVFNSLIFARSV